MKALELLLQYQYADEIGGEMMKYELDEAIAELEELMKPKSCSTSKHWGFNGDVYDDEQPRDCLKGISEGYCIAQTDSDFCCNRYEPKEQL